MLFVLPFPFCFPFPHRLRTYSIFNIDMLLKDHPPSTTTTTTHHIPVIMAGCDTQHDRRQPALAARRLATRKSSRLASGFRVLCVLAALPMCIAASATTDASPSAHVNHMPAEASVMPLEHSVVASVCRSEHPSIISSASHCILMGSSYQLLIPRIFGSSNLSHLL